MRTLQPLRNVRTSFTSACRRSLLCCRGASPWLRQSSSGFKDNSQKNNSAEDDNDAESKLQRLLGVDPTQFSKLFPKKAAAAGAPDLATRRAAAAAAAAASASKFMVGNQLGRVADKDMKKEK